jgi:hypothetical protein
MGFCSGVTNMVGDYLTTNFIGAGNVVGGSYNGAQFDMTLAAMKKVGTTTTIGTSILRTFLQAGTTNTSANQDMIFVDILKGSPNYSVFMFGPNINGGFTGCTSAQFFTQVIAATPSFGQHAYTGAVTIPFDESAGPLNAVSVWWGDTAVVCEINDMAVVLLA